MNRDFCPVCKGSDFVLIPESGGQDVPCPNPKCWQGTVEVEEHPEVPVTRLEQPKHRLPYMEDIRGTARPTGSARARWEIKKHREPKPDDILGSWHRR